MVAKLAPVTIERDAMGWWEHPQLEALLHDVRMMPHEDRNLRSLHSNGIDVTPVSIECASETDMSGASLPDKPGPEWFCVLIWSPDSIGPTAWFARNFVPQKELFEQV